MTINLDQYTNTLSVTDTATNADLNVTTKGTGGLNVNTGGGTQFKVLDLTSTTTSINARGGVNGGNAQFGLVGAGSTEFIQYTLGTGAFRFLTNGIGVDQMRIAHTASAVNYVQVTGAATGGSPAISVQGSDANPNLNLVGKGTGAVLVTTNGRNSFSVEGGTSAASNFIAVINGATGVAPQIKASAFSTDANVDLTLTPKGTGNVRFGTHTGTADTAISGYIEIKDSGGTVRKLAVIT